METGKITIENGIVSVKLENGTAWLTKCQIAGLFGVFASKVENNLRAIFKSNLLRKSDGCRFFDTLTQKGGNAKPNNTVWKPYYF